MRTYAPTVFSHTLMILTTLPGTGEMFVSFMTVMQ